MSTTKRTTAKYAYDVNGGVIRLLKKVIMADRGYNRLSYEEIRRAINARDNTVEVYNKEAGFNRRSFYKMGANEVSDFFDAKDIKGTFFSIGCHVFTLTMFNRILRAAGIRTNKLKTAKKLFAAAGY